MAKMDRALSRFTRKRRSSRNMWLSVLAALGISATAAIGVSKGRSNRWIRKMQNRKITDQHETS